MPLTKYIVRFIGGIVEVMATLVVFAGIVVGGVSGAAFRGLPPKPIGFRRSDASERWAQIAAVHASNAAKFSPLRCFRALGTSAD